MAQFIFTFEVEQHDALFIFVEVKKLGVKFVLLVMWLLLIVSLVTRFPIVLLVAMLLIIFTSFVLV
jgi:hypothetical protein